MSYIGNQSQTAYSSLVKQDITGNGGSTYTLSHPVSSENDILLYINNVKQEGGVGKAFTATGTTLTLSENISSSDSCYVQYIGLAIQTVVPPDGSVSTAKIANSAVSTAKIADSAVTNAKINNSTIDLTSKVTGVLPYANGGNQTASMASYSWNATDQNNSNTIIAVSDTIVNIGNDLASTGIYTCPVNGIYRATIWGMAGGALGNQTSGLFLVGLSIDDAFPTLSYLKKYVEPAATYSHFSADIMIPLNANQTVGWVLQANYRTLHSKFGTASFKLEHQT